MIQIDPNVAIAVVAIIGAIATGVVTIIKAIGEVKIKLTSIQSGVSDVHEAVNGSATALKEHNERNTIEAMRVGEDKAKTAYERGLAEGQIRTMREAGLVRRAEPKSDLEP